MNEKFGKAYKLCSKKQMDVIFQEGKSCKSFPFILRYSLTKTENVPFQIAISVPKRLFKKAVDRNKLKRLIREAIRKKKYILEENIAVTGKKLALFLIYTSKEKLNYSEILDKIEHLFLRLIHEKT